LAAITGGLDAPRALRYCLGVGQLPSASRGAASAGLLADLEVDSMVQAVPLLVGAVWTISAHTVYDPLTVLRWGIDVGQAGT